jgi:hypothetical protein
MKKSFIRTTALTALILVFSSLLFSSQTYAQNNDDWKLVSSEKGVNIYSQKVIITPENPGPDIEFLVFKYHNTTAVSKKLRFKLDIWYGEHCRSCDLPTPNEYQIELLLKPGEILLGKAGSDNKAFSVISTVLHKDLPHNGVTRFELTMLLIENQ